MAIQPELGLLPNRWSGTDHCHRIDSSAHRTNLVLAGSDCELSSAMIVRTPRSPAAMETFIKLRTQIAASAMRHAPVPHWLMHWGAWGLFSVAVVDSSVFPLLLPGATDLLLLWFIAHGGDPWILSGSAIGGSLLGGYTTWKVGRKGGKDALRRYVPALMLGRITRWVKHYPVLVVFLPALLPPPIPLSPFVLASGALNVSRNRFLVVFGAARCLRYSLLAWFGVSYGRIIIRMWSGTLEKWSTPLRWTIGGLIVSGVCLGIWKYLSFHRSNVAEELTRRDTPTHTD